jgi:hypothetical protein
MATWKLPPQVSSWIEPLSQVLHAKVAWRLLPLVTGMLFAQGRRTVASWLRAGGLSRDYEQFYYFVSIVGRQAQRIANLLLRLVVKELPGDDVLLFALDDTPTKRAGPKVEGAGIHHNPTPGPAEQKFLYGHIWVTLARIVRQRQKAATCGLVREASERATIVPTGGLSGQLHVSRARLDLGRRARPSSISSDRRLCRPLVRVQMAWFCS